MKILAILYLIGLSTTIMAWTHGIARFNIFLITVMCIIALVQVFRPKSILMCPWVIVFYIMTALFPLGYLETYRITTVLFTGLFCCSYMFFLDMLRKELIRENDFMTFLRYLIYAYFIVLVMQQIGVVTNSWIINKGGFVNLSITKLNSLSTEPAHSTTILFLAINSYLTLSFSKKEKAYALTDLMKEETSLFLMYSYSMLTMGSVTGIILYAFSFFIQNRLNMKQLLVMLLFFLLIPYIIANWDFSLFERIKTFFDALWEMDAEYLRRTDASAAARLAPFMLYLNDLDIFSYSFWCGYGIDHCQLINRAFFHYDLDSESGMGGLIPNYLIDFGFLPFSCFFIMAYKYCLKTVHSSFWWNIIVLCLVCLPSGINTALLWFCIVTLSANQFFLDERKVPEEPAAPVPESADFGSGTQYKEEREL